MGAAAENAAFRPIWAAVADCGVEATGYYSPPSDHAPAQLATGMAFRAREAEVMLRQVTGPPDPRQIHIPG